jgi:hypothetical protein
MFMKQKRRVWHDAMMPEVDKRINKGIADLSGSIINTMYERVNDLEGIVMKQEKRSSIDSATRSFSRANERGRSLSTIPTPPMPPMPPLRQQSIHHIIPGSTETSSNDLISALTSQNSRLISINPLTPHDINVGEKS